MRRFKLVLAVTGFSLAAVGVALDLRIMVWAAMIVLTGALAIRLWGRRRQTTASAGESEGGTG